MKKPFLFFAIVLLNTFGTSAQNTTLFSDNFETTQTWNIFEEIVSGNTCYGANIGEVIKSNDVKHGGNNALRVWSNKNSALKSNHVIGSHTISSTQGVTGRLRYGTWVYCGTNPNLTQSGPEISVQSTRTVGAQNLTFIAGIQYIGNQWISDKWNIWHNGTWKAIKLSELGATLTTNTWYYMELEFNMTTNKYLSFKIQGGGLNTTLDLTQAFSNAASGFEIGGEARGWTPSYFVTAESENLWTGCTEARENKVYYDDMILESILPPTSPQCYQLVWADEFSGAALDLSKWTPIVGPGGAVSGNNELQYYTDRSQNIQVSDGSLKIIALQENYGGNAYTSARMETKNMGDWRYGRLEARIKLPVAQGMWPAFWMLPTDNVYGIWPKSGEIDIMELIGSEPSHVYGTIHTHSNGNVQSYSSLYSLSTGTFADDFHTFTTEWSPNLIKFYVDGNLYGTKTNTSVSPYPWLFDQKFYMLLNLAVGGDWGGVPNASTTFPQQMEVDYVRVYQKLDNVSITGKILVEPGTSGVSYSVPAINGVTYQWSVTGSGNTIASGQGSNHVTINWGSNNGTISVVMNDACVPSATVSTDVTVSANLWDNFGFEQNYLHWDTRPAYSPIVNFNISTTNVAEGTKAACVQVNTAQPSPWNIQLSRINLDLLAGVSYTLQFKAKANANRTIPIAFIKSSNFSSIAYSTINLTTNWQTFSLTFTPTSNVNAMFNADVATEIGTYCFDDFVFARTALLLPITLLDFRGKIDAKGNTLTWKFADKKDLQYLELQSSADSKFFTSLSPLNTNDEFFIDKNALGLTYYRLKMEDNSGKPKYSNIVSLHRTRQGRAFIFPNPVQNELTIQNANGQSIEITNTLGQTQLYIQDFQSQTLDIQSFESGVYFVKIGDTVFKIYKN